MTLTAAELAALVAGQLLRGPAERPLSGIAALDEAGSEDAAFFGNAKYLPALRRTRAGAVLVPASHAAELLLGLETGAALVTVENPTLAFSQLIARFAPPAPGDAPGVHPTAVLGRGVVLGEGVSVQAHAVLEDDVRVDARTVIAAGCFLGRGTVVGADCRLHPRVVLREGTRVGNRVIIQPGAVIGGDGFGFELVDGRHVKIPQVGSVQIDDDVEIGANTTIDRARFGRTRIGENTKIDNLVQIAHNVVIGPHCLIVSQAGISGSTKLGKYVTLAGQAGVVGHVELGDFTVVGAKSGVSKNTPPHSKLFGLVGEPLDQAKANLARVRRLPKLIEKVKQLEAEVAALKAALSGAGNITSSAAD